MFKAGDHVVVPKATNSTWHGVGVVDKMWDDDAVSLTMLSGKYAGQKGTFRISEGVYLNSVKAYLCLCDDGCYIAHEGNLEDIPSYVTAVWAPGKQLERKTVWSEV